MCPQYNNTHTDTHTHTHTWAHTCTHIHAHTHTNTHMHTHARTRTHTNTHTHLKEFQWLPSHDTMPCYSAIDIPVIIFVHVYAHVGTDWKDWKVCTHCDRSIERLAGCKFEAGTCVCAWYLCLRVCVVFVFVSVWVWAHVCVWVCMCVCLGVCVCVCVCVCRPGGGKQHVYQRKREIYARTEPACISKPRYSCDVNRLWQILSNNVFL